MSNGIKSKEILGHKLIFIHKETETYFELVLQLVLERGRDIADVDKRCNILKIEPRIFEN